MDNSSNTHLRGERLLATQFELVCSTAVAGIFYGVAFTLYCQYTHSLIPQFRNEDRKRQAKFMLAYTTILMLCGLYYLVANIVIIQDAYIKHSDYPSGPYAYESSIFHTQPVIAVGLACQVVINMLTSAVQIWRVWVVWSGTRYAELAIVLPSLCFLGFSALQWRTVALQSTLPVREVFKLDSKSNTAEDTLQGATTILCTLLVSGYLIFQCWRNRKLTGESQATVEYISIIAMLVESYATESIWIFIMMLANGSVDHPVGIFFADTTVYIEIIAYLLVLHRVSRGREYGSSKWQRNISSLNWNHSSHTTTVDTQCSPAPVGAIDIPRESMA